MRNRVLTALLSIGILLAVVGVDRLTTVKAQPAQTIQSVRSQLSTFINDQYVYWPTPFVDANYVVTCEVQSNLGSTPPWNAQQSVRMHHMRDVQAAYVRVVVYLDPSVPVGYTPPAPIIHCIGVHN